MLWAAAGATTFEWKRTVAVQGVINIQRACGVTCVLVMQQVSGDSCVNAEEDLNIQTSSAAVHMQTRTVCSHNTGAQRPSCLYSLVPADNELLFTSK